MSFIIPRWPVPAHVRAVSTLRQGGVSQSSWKAFNLGAYVGDDPDHVACNRQRLVELASLPTMPQWLHQVHGTDIVRLVSVAHAVPVADGCITNHVGVVCAIMTADCLPVLFCSDDGEEVAAAHAGWRGLCGGILENTIAQFGTVPQKIHVWLGPAIGPHAFKVNMDVQQAFVMHDSQAMHAFRPVGNKFFVDIWQLAKQRLQVIGVKSISMEPRCTYTQQEKFFSYRRDGVTGRMATLIWLS